MSRPPHPPQPKLAPLPKSEDALVIQTYFGDPKSWQAVKETMLAPVGRFQAYVHIIEDRAYDGASVAQLMEAAADLGVFFLFVADETTITEADHALLVVWLGEDPGRTFRLVPRALQEVENNLSTSSMDFEEFEDALGDDGVFRNWAR